MDLPKELVNIINEYREEIIAININDNKYSIFNVNTKELLSTPDIQLETPGKIYFSRLFPEHNTYIIRNITDFFMGRIRPFSSAVKIDDLNNYISTPLITSANYLYNTGSPYRYHLSTWNKEKLPIEYSGAKPLQSVSYDDEILIIFDSKISDSPRLSIYKNFIKIETIGINELPFIERNNIANQKYCFINQGSRGNPRSSILYDLDNKKMSEIKIFPLFMYPEGSSEVLSLIGENTYDLGLYNIKNNSFQVYVRINSIVDLYALSTRVNNFGVVIKLSEKKYIIAINNRFIIYGGIEGDIAII